MGRILSRIFNGETSNSPECSSVVVHINPGEENYEPWCLPQHELGNWFSENIQHGTNAFAKDCKSAIDSVVQHIYCRCSENILAFHVYKVVKGGSLGKGTMVKDLSDVDLVAFVSQPYLEPISKIEKEEYKETLSGIIADLTSTLRGVQNVQIIRSDEYLLNFKIQVGSRWIDVDLLPTTDNVPKFQRSYRKLFLTMLDCGNGTRQLYSASFVQYRKQFVKEQPGYVKELIRLVKYWASRFLPKYLQKSYPLELITIYRWEKAGKPSYLDKAQGLRSVLKVLTKLDRLRVYWSYMSGVDYQLNEIIIRKLDMKSPIVLDPANPTNNVCFMYKEDKIEVLASAAKRTLKTDLLKSVTVWPYFGEYRAHRW
ncbi:2'-5'-oligoadenylate synthase 1A-like [Asterias amurensis]|uniref:2'-5'-oligoadenylate synthase 1A-like n=1 Tax=Asterias amurensis TaxID=7602 RepID=UPI003AB58EA3